MSESIFARWRRWSLVMVVGVMMAQVAGHVIWARQLRAASEVEATTAAGHLGHNAARAVRYFLSLPPNYRPLVIQQFREKGGAPAFSSTSMTPPWPCAPSMTIPLPPSPSPRWPG